MTANHSKVFPLFLAILGTNCFPFLNVVLLLLLLLWTNCFPFLNVVLLLLLLWTNCFPFLNVVLLLLLWNFFSPLFKRGSSSSSSSSSASCTCAWIVLYINSRQMYLGRIWTVNVLKTEILRCTVSALRYFRPDHATPTESVIHVRSKSRVTKLIADNTSHED